MATATKEINYTKKFASLAVNPRKRSKASLVRQIEGLEGLANNLFGIEEMNKDIITTKLGVAKLALASEGSEYPVLSIEPLTWTRRVGTKTDPVFAVFSLTSPIMSLTRRVTRSGWPRRWESSVTPKLPEAIERIYRVHVTNKSRDCQVTMTARFNGVFPQEVREKIIKATSVFKQKDIFVIAEVNWNTKITPLPKPDPLVVAWDGQALRLIAQFDLTPIEKYFVKEFPG